MRGTFFLLALLFSVHAAWGQRSIEDTEEASFRDRIYFGGGGVLQFTQNTFVIGASPLVGYMFNKRLSAGVGATYLFSRYGGLYDRNTHTYGGRTFVRYNVLKNVYSMAEYEMLNIERFSLTSELPRLWIDRVLLGGGYFQPMGNRGGFTIGIFYDLLYRPGIDNPYNSPWVYRVGFTF